MCGFSVCTLLHNNIKVNKLYENNIKSYHNLKM